MRQRRNRGYVLGRAFACVLGTLLTVGVVGSPAWAASSPDAPAAPTVTRGNGTLIVAVSPPVDNGRAITGYAATCTSSDGGVPGSASAPVPLVTVSGVTNAKSYTCIARATNGIGNSADSPASSPAVVVAFVPAAPAVPTLTSGNGQIRATFAPGASNDPIISNTATCTATGDSPVTATGSSPLAVSGLTNGKTYACHVASTNGVGVGAASPDRTIVAGLPDAPVQPTLAAGDTQLVVGFIPPSLNGSAPTVVPYTAGCFSIDGGTAASGSATGSPITVSGVSNGKTYTCHVTAHNTVGAGPDSPESAWATPAGIPDPPAAPTIRPGNNLMQVAFTPPANNGAQITRYNVTCTSSDGGATGTATGTASPINVPGLTNGNTYTCDVSATNRAGTGSISDESDPGVANAVPAPPSKPTLTGGSKSLAAVASR